MSKNGRPQKIYSDEQKLEVKKAYKKCHNAKEKSRLLCLKLRVIKQMPTKQIASILDLSEGYIDSIINQYSHKGIESIAAKKQGGNHNNMTFQEEIDFLVPFHKKAIVGEILEVSEIIKAYSDKLNKKVSKSTVYDMLHRHGWRKVMPRKEHPKKASPEEIEAYKKNAG